MTRSANKNRVKLMETYGARQLFVSDVVSRFIYTLGASNRINYRGHWLPVEYNMGRGWFSVIAK